MLPTDTVYGIGADAFTPAAVTATARGQGPRPDMPVPVLVGAASTLDGLVDRRCPPVAHAAGRGVLAGRR